MLRSRRSLPRRQRWSCVSSARTLWDEHLSQRLVERRGWAFILSTPRGRGWFHDAYQRGQGSDPAYQSWTGPTWDNPHISRDAVEAERARLEPEAFRQEYEGRFVGPGIPQCDLCGYPRSEFGPIPVFHNSEEPGTCAACGHLVMADGRSIAFQWDDGPIVEHSVTLFEIHHPREPPQGNHDDDLEEARLTT